MVDTQTFNQHSFSTENDQAEGYKKLSRLAVWSVPLGLLSALSLVSPLLWFLPLTAATFALVGLRVISQSNDTTGRRLALTGLGLAILFGTWGMTWTIARRMAIHHQAREHASEWLTLMQQGEDMKAHQLATHYNERRPIDVSLEAYYTVGKSESAEYKEPPEQMPILVDSTPYSNLYNFKNYGITGTLLAAKGKFEFEFVKNTLLHREGHLVTNVDQVFHVTFSEGHQPREMDVKIELKRNVDARKAYWEVAHVSEVNKTP